MVGSDVRADVHDIRSGGGVGPRDHGMYGLVADGIGADDGEYRGGRASIRGVVVGRLVRNLRHGCYGVTICGLENIRHVRRVVRGPLRVRFLVDGRPDLAGVEGGTVYGTVPAVDESLVGDLDELGGTIVAVALRIELDRINVVGRARSASALDDAVGIGPGNGSQGRDEVAVAHRALNRVVELGALLIEEIAHIFPRRSRRREACCGAVLRDDEVVDRFGDVGVGDLLRQRCRCRQYEGHLSVVDRGLIDRHAIEALSTADALEVSEFLDHVESRRKTVIGQ